MLAIGSFLFFTGLVAVLSWWLTRNDSLDSATGYFLAGRRLTWIVIAGSLLLTNISTEQLVGLNGGAFKDGMEIMAWELGAALAMVIMALFCLPQYLLGGITTVPEYLEGRYDKLVRSLVSLLILVSMSISVLPFVLYSGALFMRDVFHVPEVLHVSENAGLWIMVLAIGIVGSIYAIFGGLGAVAVSDTLNGVGLLIAGMLIPILGLLALGDGNAVAGLDRLHRDHVELLNPLGETTSDLPVSTLFSGVALLHLYYWCTNQFIVQRTFGARSLEQGQKGILFAAFMKLFGPLYLVLPGVMAFHLYGSEISPDGNNAYSTLVSHLLPKPLVGFFAAAIFGAILSSFNSALNSCSTLFSVDLVKGYLNPQATDHQMVRVGKIFGTILAMIIIGVTPFLAGGGPIFDTMKKLAATFDVPLMVIVFVGLLSKRTSTMGAGIAAIVGVVFYATVTFGMDNKILGHEIHWLHVAGLNFLLMMAIVGVFRFLKPRAVAYEHANTSQVDLAPWAFAKPAAVFVIISVFAIYFCLWRISA